MDVLLAERVGWRWGFAEMARVLRSLHAAGWVYRDMYWNHVFVDGPESGLWLVDVERAFRPEWRLHRWVVKDLAGLLSGLEAGGAASRGDCLRFLHEYSGGRAAGWKGLARQILRKARRIRKHVPKFP